MIFATYSGPHTGLDEATQVGIYMQQFFEHIGFNVIDEWYILSEFHVSLENSTKGRRTLRGKPTQEELIKIKENAKSLAIKYRI